jgi:hypothetical protein
VELAGESMGHVTPGGLAHDFGAAESSDGDA